MHPAFAHLREIPSPTIADVADAIDYARDEFTDPLPDRDTIAEAIAGVMTDRPQLRFRSRYATKANATDVQRAMGGLVRFLTGNGHMDTYFIASFQVDVETFDMLETLALVLLALTGKRARGAEAWARALGISA